LVALVRKTAEWARRGERQAAFAAEAAAPTILGATPRALHVSAPLRDRRLPAIAGPALRNLLNHWPRPRWGTAHVGAHVDEADEQIIRANAQGRFHRFVVSRLACAPEGAEALRKRREHEAVSRTPGRDDLLDDRNLRGPVVSRRDDD